MEQKEQASPGTVVLTGFLSLCGVFVLYAIISDFMPHRGPGNTKSGSDLSNIKQLGIAVQMYQADYDMRMPLSHGTDDSTGQHGYDHYKYVPFDWSQAPTPAARSDYSRTFVMNTLQPYVKNDQIMASPGMDEYLFREKEKVYPGKKKGTTTYAYNGLLHAYDHAAIVSAEQLPLFTAANGNRVGVGVGIANPALKCDTAYDPCVYVPRTDLGCQTGNGGKGVMFTKYAGSSSSYWLYKKGQNWAFNDSHAKYRRVGENFSPNQTDLETDPWVFYNEKGHARSYYWDGCHPYLFRPDYAFDN